MQLAHLPLLRSPATGKPLELFEAEIINGHVKSGILREKSGLGEWPVIEYIPRFVPINNYSDNFSIQWEKYAHVLDPRKTGLTLYEDRWNKETKWPKDMTGELVLEAGCGPGVFTYYALQTGATVMAFDYSTSVEVAYRENKNDNLLLVQADICNIPFVQADRAFCFGVLQHTPNPRESFASLLKALKPNGKLACDIYRKVPLKFGEHLNILKTKYFLRRWTANMNPQQLEWLVNHYVNLFWPLANILIKSGRPGLLLCQLFLFNNWAKDWPDTISNLDKKFEKDLTKVMMYDMLSAKYDIPVTEEEFLSWHKEEGLQDVDVHPGYNGLEGRSVKDISSPLND